MGISFFQSCHGLTLNLSDVNFLWLIFLIRSFCLRLLDDLKISSRTIVAFVDRFHVLTSLILRSYEPKLVMRIGE